MNSFRSTYKKYPIIGNVILVIILIPIMRTFRKIPIGILHADLLTELFIMAIVLSLICLVTGKKEIEFSTKGFKYAFKVAWWPFLFDCLLAILALTFEFLKGSKIIGNPFITFIECLVFGLSVGLFEEGLFRGLILSSLLNTYGDSFKGLLKSCIYTSLLFGFFHVYTDFFGFFTNPETFSFVALMQVLGKTLDTGLIGFIYSVIVIKNENIWSVAILHGLNDFGSFITTFLFSTGENLQNYVNTSGDGLGTTMSFSYILHILIELPVAIYAYKQLKNTSLPQWGMFKVHWAPRIVDTKNSSETN